MTGINDKYSMSQEKNIFLAKDFLLTLYIKALTLRVLPLLMQILLTY